MAVVAMALGRKVDSPMAVVWMAEAVMAAIGLVVSMAVPEGAVAGVEAVMLVAGQATAMTVVVALEVVALEVAVQEGEVRAEEGSVAVDKAAEG